MPLVQSGGDTTAPDILAGIISKLLSDLVARNDQVCSLTHVLTGLALMLVRRGLAVATRPYAGHTLSLLTPTCHHCEELPRGPVLPESLSLHEEWKHLPVFYFSLCSILKYAGCSEETFILALIYMDQVVQFNPDFVISSLNVRTVRCASVHVSVGSVKGWAGGASAVSPAHRRAIKRTRDALSDLLCRRCTAF